jgi:hypothetical protein
MSSKERLMQVLVRRTCPVRAAERAADDVPRRAHSANPRSGGRRADVRSQGRLRAGRERDGQAKRFGGRPGKRSDWKKAYVKLAQGQTIDFAGVEK